MALRLLTFALLATASSWAAAPASEKPPTFRDQVSEIEQARDGSYRVRFQQRGWVYTIEEKDKSGLQCLLRSVRLLKDVNVQFDLESRKVLGCEFANPR